MKKVLLTLMCVAAMMAVGTGLKAQEVTITIMPGCNWISVPLMDTLDFQTALGSFIPEQGDIIKSKWNNAHYRNGQWVGRITQFYPGYGYMYISKRTIPVFLTFNAQQPTPQVVVTTSEPTDITTNSAICGGNVASSNGDYVFVILRGICWGTNPNPTFNDNYIEAGNGLGSFTVSMTELTSGSTYYVRAFAVTPMGTFYGEEEIFTTDHEFVDLGLPSGTLWATINVGANAPEEYGDYFAWGEISPKDYYDWSNYLHSINNGSTLIKYVYPSSYVQYQIIDSLTVLMPEDDAATANWGEDWRMPTKEEWQELYQSTSHEWTTQDGVNGMLFTAQNGNSIFLPAAGTYSQSGLNYEGDQGMYWSSNLVTDFVSSLAWCFRFMTDDYAMIYGQRQNGYPVRPVRPGVLNPSFIIDATANPAEGGVVTGGGSYFEGTECTLTATANEGYAFTNWTENDEVVSADATYTFTVNADRTLVANFTSNGGGDDHEYVDLGLPSGTLWATCNIGADTPEGYGDYFAWGETQPKDAYDWSTYQYCNGSYNMLTKYCNNSSYGYNGFTDNLTTLLPEDDAATANWGNDWRMPTKDDWQELIQNSSITWVSQNGVNGFRFTGSNGNSVFFPAAGTYNGSNPGIAGNNGFYSSSSLHTDNSNSAWRLYFRSDYYQLGGSYGRYGGHSIRAVRCKNSVISVTANSNEGGVVSGGGSYMDHTNCTVSATPNEGYTFTNWTDNGVEVSTEETYSFTVTGNRTLMANFTASGGGNAPTGAINGKFTINSNGDQVYFSQGNLQYIGSAATPYWKFADHQWDVLGTATSQNSSSQNVDRDLFGWGTSGWNNGNMYYQPYDTQNNGNASQGYGYGPTDGTSYTYNLTGTYANADWGVYNPISNGGNQANQWRTLTQDEWAHVFNTRTTSSGIRYAKANVNDVNGVILLPDDWSSDTYSLSNTNNSSASYSSNVIIALQWSALEQAGAVFLPAAAGRLGTSVINVGSYGNYWSVSYFNSYFVWGVGFGDTYLGADNYGLRCDGVSVRLVAPAEN